MGVYMAFFPECKDSSEPSLASRKRRPNKNNMRTNHQGSSPNKNVVNCGNVRIVLFLNILNVIVLGWWN